MRHFRIQETRPVVNDAQDILASRSWINSQLHSKGVFSPYKPNFLLVFAV
jgi:hypothetical protein